MTISVKLRCDLENPAAVNEAMGHVAHRRSPPEITVEQTGDHELR